MSKQPKNRRHEASAELAALIEVGTALGETTTKGVVPLLEKLYSQISRFLHVSNFFVALYDAASDTVEFRFVIEDGKRQQTTNEWAPRRAGKGLTEYIIKNPAPLLIAENFDSWLSRNNIPLIGRRAQSWLGVPLIARNEVIGVLAIQDYLSPRTYNHQHMRIIRAIADQAAVALDNAALFQFQTALLHSVPHPVIAVDRHGRITHLNHAAEEIVASNRQAMLKQPVRNYYWERGNEARKVQDLIINAEQPQYIETYVRSTHDDKIPVQLSASAIRDEEDRFIGSIAVLQDLRFSALQGRRRALFTLVEKLNHTNDLDTAAASLVVDGLLLVDLSHSFVIIQNGAALQVKAVMGCPLPLAENEDYPWEDSLLRDALASDQVYLAHKLPFQGYRAATADALSVVLVPLRSHLQTVGIFVAESTVDQSPQLDREMVDLLARQAGAALARISLANEREHLTSQLIASSEQIAIGRIAAGVSHDVKGGLHTIGMALESIREALERNPKIPGAKALIAQIQAAEKRTDALAYLARHLQLYSEHFTPVKSNASVNRLILDLEDLLSSTVAKKGCKLRLELDGQLGGDRAVGGSKTAFVDSRQIQQVIVNLVLNASDATIGNKGLITITTKYQPAAGLGSRPEAWISVKDHGAGISRDLMPKIFDPFFTTKSKGTGLGLYICRLIITENHSGKIEVSSKSSAGSTFTIRIPV